MTLSFSFLGSPEERAALEGKDIRDVEVGERLVVTLMEEDSNLPSFISAERSVAPGFTGNYKALRMSPMHSGVIEIETWDVNGLIRGAIRGKMGFVSDIDVHFSANLAVQESEALE